MGDLRRPFFIAALVLAVMLILVELGAAAVVGGNSPGLSDIETVIPNDPEIRGAYDDLDDEQEEELLAGTSGERPPGLAISYLALIDGLLLLTVGLLGASLVIPPNAVGRVQGLTTLVVSIIVILVGIILALAAIIQLVLMVSLLLAVPFGTLAYLAKFGFFDRGGAALAISLVMLLKIGLLIGLFVAQQRFLQNKGLMLLVGTSLVATLIVSFLHGFVPLFLVSIADAIGAIVIAIIAIIWAIVLLVGSLNSLLRVARAN